MLSAIVFFNKLLDFHIRHQISLFEQLIFNKEKKNSEERINYELIISVGGLTGSLVALISWA